MLTEKITAKVLIVLLTYFSISCSSSENTSNDKKDKSDDEYVFDEIPPKDLYVFETPEEKSNNDSINYKYIVQIGAFSTFESARMFADNSRKKLNQDIKVDFNSKINLYVVEIHPPFKSKAEALKCRDELLKDEEYNDAWVKTLKENNK